jgi:O-antigen/teichoic acid export membrane protein
VSDPNRYLNTAALTPNLKRATVRGGAYTLLAQGTKFVLSLGATAVLARLLTPADYGLVAMVAALMAFAAIFKDLGLAMATVQQAEITHSQVSSLFWINQVIGLLLGILVAGCAPLAAWFYEDPRLRDVTLILAITFILGGLTIQHQALLRRQMRFRALAAIDVAALVVGTAVAVLLALGGAGYWALVWRQVTVAIVAAAGVWLLCGWRPGALHRRTGSKAMLAFGGHLTLSNGLNYFARNMDRILLGRRWGDQELGLYTKAFQLLLLPIQQVNAPVSSVAIPALSRIKDDPARYRRYYCSAMNLIGHLTTPLIVIMAVLSDEIVAIVLGRQWHGASGIFRVLAIAAIGRPMADANSWIYISLGRGRRMLYWGALSAPLFVLAFVIGVRWGAVGVAMGYALCALTLRLPAFMWALHATPVRLRDLARATYRSTALSMIMLAVMIPVRLAMAPHGAMPVLIVTGAAGAAALVLGLYLWPGARREAAKLIETARMLNLAPRR